MKNLSYLLVAAFAVAGFSSAHADLSADSGYSVTDYYTQSGTSDNIQSFDWDPSGNLYFEDASPSYTFDGLYEVKGSQVAAGTATNVVAGNSSQYPGESVVSVGNNIYYNTSDSNDSTESIYQYGPVNGTPANTLASNSPSYGLYPHGGGLFLTGSPDFGTNHIYYSALNANGSFASNPAIDLGEDSGASGPLAFDSAGNLYYAPGYYDQSVYKWTAAQVAAALANPAQNPLSISEATKWLDYSASPDFDSFSGGTSMVIDGNQLLLTLTDFSGSSELASFGIGSNGDYDGAANAVVDASDLVGDLREYDGNIFLADDNSIFEIDAVPEPSSWALLLCGGLLLVALGRRGLRFRAAGLREILAVAVLLPFCSGRASAIGAEFDYNSATQQFVPPAGIYYTEPTLWATGVVNFSPGPVEITDPSGAKANYGTPQSALGASDAINATYVPGSPPPVVSLGDGGSITLSFSTPIANGPGADLAVYENGFEINGNPNSDYLELGTVAVSSDGIHFFTFPSVSLTPTTPASAQVGSFGGLDPRNLYNLAGSDLAGYGTPFDLSDLSGINSPYLNLNDITEVRVTDVIGNIDTSMGVNTYTDDDAKNPIFNGLWTTDHVINDPYPTDFNTGGFDLDAIAELNIAPEPQSWTLFLAGGLMACFAFRRRLFCRD